MSDLQAERIDVNPRIETIREVFWERDTAEHKRDPHGSVRSIRMNSEDIEYLLTAYDEQRAIADRLAGIVEVTNNLVMALSDQPATPPRIEGEAEGWLDELVLALMGLEDAADEGTSDE